MADKDNEWGDGACNNTLGWGLAQTKFGCATPCADAIVKNSNGSYDVKVASGGFLSLPDITVTDSNGSTFTAPAVTNVTCTPAVSRTTAMLMKTGQTTSFRTGDDGDLEAGRATDFLTLSENNPYGNTKRFLDELGGTTYTNNIVIDWSTFDGSTVLGISRINIATGSTWNQAIDNCLSYSVGSFTSGWRLPNMKEIFNLMNYANDPSSFLNYSPINLSSVGRLYWSSNTVILGTTAAYGLNNVGMTGQFAKTSSANMTYFRVRTFTVTGTTLS